jgi:xylulokinase
VVAASDAPVATSTPHQGWAEQEPGDWYAALCTAVTAAVDQVGGAARVAAVGFSGGAHIGVLTDANGGVVRPALLWSDTRSAAESVELHQRAGERIVAVALNRVNPTWLLPQLLWLRRHEPDAVERVRRVTPAKDWLRERLTSVWVTDPGDAAGTLLADPRSNHWSDELCALAEWPVSTLPPLVASNTMVGGVRREVAADVGLLAGTPVVCGSIDTSVELLGAGAVDAGDSAVKLATAGVVSQVTGAPVVNPPVSCYPHVVAGRWYTATGTNSCATAHRWVRDLMFAPAGEGFDEMDALAASVAPGSDGLLFHPYLQGERAPYWDPDLRGDLLGLTIRHTRAHVARATYEGIALSLRDVMETAEAVGGNEYREVRLLGGGARSPTWRRIVADVLGRSALRPASADASFGAALVAGVASGVYADERDAVRRGVRIEERLEPDPALAERYDELFAIYREATARLRELSHRLGQA